jgi:uncharacterized protein
MSNSAFVEFSSGESHYVYSACSNAIVKIDASVKQILDDYFHLDRSELKKAHPDLSKAALNRGIRFIEDAIHNGGLFQPLSAINFLRTLTPDEFQEAVEGGLSELCLNVTDRCNQSCSYCNLTHSRLSRPKKAAASMTWEIARNSLDSFLATTSAQRQVGIGFYGGEPLVNWKLIQKCLHYLRESYAGRKIRIRLISNLTLLKQSILETLIDSDAHLQVSLDGPQQIHDAARSFGDGRGTHQQVFDRLAQIRAVDSNYFHNNISLHCTFDKQNDLLEIFRYFSEGMPAELPVSLGFVSSSFPDRFPLSPEQSARHEQRVERLIEMYLVALRNNSRFNYDLFWDILRDPLLLSRRTIGLAPDPGWPNQTCVPGARRLFVTANGTFYPCANFCPQGWDIGSHGTGIEYPKAQVLFQTYANLCQETCQGCWAHRLCSCCYLSMVSRDQVDISAKAEKCERERNRIVKSLRRFVYIWENEPQETHDYPFSLHFQVRSQKSS